MGFDARRRECLVRCTATPRPLATIVKHMDANNDSAHDEFSKRMKLYRSPIDLETLTCSEVLPCGHVMKGDEIDRLQQSEFMNLCPECRKQFIPEDVIPSAQLNAMILNSKNQMRQDIYAKHKYKTMADFQQVHLQTVDELMASGAKDITKPEMLGEVLQHVRQQYSKQQQHIETLQNELTFVLGREEKADTALADTENTLLQKSRELQCIRDKFNKHQPTFRHVHEKLSDIYRDCLKKHVEVARSNWLHDKLKLIYCVLAFNR